MNVFKILSNLSGATPTHSWIKRLRGIAVACAAVAVSVAGFAGFSSDPQFPAPPGRIIDVNGKRMHVIEQGTQQNGPTVVLETGFSGASIGWAWIQPEIARFARVVSYDRAGLGWSEETGDPHDATETARRLQTLLKQLDAPPPYVMVGHSLGGIFVRRFAAMYPDEVGALVLIDSAHPQQVERLGAFHHRHPYELVMLGRALANIGLVEWFGIPDEINSLPPAARSAAHYFIRSGSHWSAMVREAAAFHTSLQQASMPASLGDLPLIVLSATQGRLPGWNTLQRELSQLSTQGEWRAPPRTDHYGLVTNSEQSRYTIAAIKDAWQQVTRQETTLHAQVHPAL
jgi:pimeloyl-ACP methyl ester carboxylesterase